jgi:hypothetical protein
LTLRQAHFRHRTDPWPIDFPFAASSTKQSSSLPARCAFVMTKAQRADPNVPPAGRFAQSFFYFPFCRAALFVAASLCENLGIELLP